MSSQLPYPPPGCTGRWNCKACRQAGFVFACDFCRRIRPWCLGVNDDHPNCCDVCRHRWHHHGDMTPFILERQPQLWLHGHTHDSRDVTIGKTRLLCNPFGYARSNVNPGFNERLIIEV